MTREEAKEHLEFLKIMDAPKLREAVDMAIEALQERPKGRWEHLGGDEWCCSNCGHVIFTEGSWEEPDAKFCEECGADMRESE